MGLGKTIQTLVFLQTLKANGSKTHSANLLVVPRSLLINWQREAERFTPDIKILEYFDARQKVDLTRFDEFDIVITSYGILLRDIQRLKNYLFWYVILDESQAIKNPLSQTARAARLLKTEHRLCLTGTPVENSTIELWSQFSFLNPGLLGSLEYFKREIALPIEKNGDQEEITRLRKLVAPFILRRTKDQVAPELPLRTERLLLVDMLPTQRKMYEKVREQYGALVNGLADEQSFNQNRMQVLEGLLRLRQIANHPRLFESQYRGGSGKFELIEETLATLQAEGHRALVFSQFVQMLRIVRESLDNTGTPYAYLDGSTKNRQGQVDTFQSDPAIPFFLVSLKAGGKGLNLTAADYVIHIDPWWNPAVEDQASDRAHRIGQDKPVFIYKLITRNSVEEKIIKLQERKKSLVSQVIISDSTFYKKITLDEILDLFT
jgi:non-specific serine/threonine protein kinase